MLYVLLTAAVVWGLATIYLAYRFREFRKFLARRVFCQLGNPTLSLFRESVGAALGYGLCLHARD